MQRYQVTRNLKILIYVGKIARINRNEGKQRSKQQK